MPLNCPKLYISGKQIQWEILKLLGGWTPNPLSWGATPRPPIICVTIAPDPPSQKTIPIRVGPCCYRITTHMTAGHYSLASVGVISGSALWIGSRSELTNDLVFPNQN